MSIKQLSPRWAGTTPAQRSAHMRALARRRMRKLTPAQRAAIGRALVAARKKKG